MKPYSKILNVLFLLLLTIFFGCNEDEVVPQNRLVAKAGDDRVSKVTEETLLDASESYDGDNKPLTYLWSVKVRPTGSTATLAFANTVKARFTPDVVGSYTIQLLIMSDKWSAKDELQITATPVNPDGPVAMTLSENITVNTTLADIFEDPSQPDYIVTNNIDVHADLIIMPGVSMVFGEDKGLQIVSGSIQAVGTAEKGIIFKGMNTGPAYWKGILIHSNSELNKFAHVTIQQGGSSIFPEGVAKANLSLSGFQQSGAAVEMHHVTFKESGGYGLYVQEGSAFSDFSNNAFSNNNTAAAFIPASLLHKIDVDSFMGNENLETGGAVTHPNVTTWKKLQGGSYIVCDDIRIEAGLKIEAGASFKMKAGVTIAVLNQGSLHANGTATQGITFSSVAPNTRWNGLYFNSANQNNILNYCEVSNAGMNTIGGAAHQGNIVVGPEGILTVENSIIKNGLGYGVVMNSSNQVNADVTTVNTFDNLQKGAVYPAATPNLPPMTGAWMDYWSFFTQGATAVTNNYYNTQTSTWFGGAADPWAMANAGFGIQFNQDGHFIWTAAERSPWTGCNSYSAEYMTGTAAISATAVVLDLDFWRSKFINSCDETQNVDTNVTPFEVSLPYQILEKQKPSGEKYWELKFTNPDGSTFSYYRKS